MNPFTLCLNTSTIRPASLEDKIRAAATAGYQAVELWSDDLTAHEAAGRSLSEVSAWVEDAGLRVASVIALFNWMDSKDGAEKHEAFFEARRRMEQAAALGARHIVASPVPDSDALDMQRAAGRYRELLELGREIGVIPAMEFLGFFHNVYRLDQALQIAHAAEHEDACIVLDPFHLFRGGSGFDKIADVPANMIGICHFNDAPASPPRIDQRDEHRVYPGDGILPLVQMLRNLAAGGYQGALSLELFNPSYWEEDAASVASVGLEKMKAVISTSQLSDR